jgi:hypothetical protein
MRSKTLTKTIALTLETRDRVLEIKNRLHLRTYDDVIKYLLGDFK